jgi:hypothetical protein
MDVNALVSARDEKDGDGGDQDRKQSHPLHDPTEFPENLEARAWGRV